MTHAGPTHESSLLLTLEEISQLVSHSHNPSETLANIVCLIHSRFHSDVCSVYLLELGKDQLVLSATVGLKTSSVGHVRMRLTEGLTGLVAEKMAPVMVDEAFDHPRFKYFPEAGEDLYHSFLGVPLIEGGSLQGVLVIQTKDRRIFSANEIRMLVTVGAQLAPLVSEVRLLEQVVAAHESTRTSIASDEEAWRSPLLQGHSLSPGVGLGQAYVVDRFEQWQKTATPPRSTSLEDEKNRLHAAMSAACEEIGRLSHRISTLVGEDHGAILQGQLLIMQDSTIAEDLHAALIAGNTAEASLLQTLHKYVELFQKLTDPFFQERVYDIKDVFRRVLWHLRPMARGAQAKGDRLVLVSQEASVLDLFSVDLDRLAGVVVEHGGSQCHAAILARSLGIPMVGHVLDLHNRVQSGRFLRVDGSAGTVHLDPIEAESGLHTTAPAVAVDLETSVNGASYLPDRPRLETNINLLSEVAEAIARDTRGVGLYRSEFLCLARRTLPTEEEQVGVYRKLLQLFKGRPVSIRTFDLRPDKLTHHPQSSTSSHPMDWRLVLHSPPVQKLFKDQVRAILRAATDGSARILVPLVTCSEQLDFILAIVTEAKEELARERLEFQSDVPVGIMVEVAAATMMVASWAPRVDFVALGTNDFLASCLGIDRDDPVGSSPDDPLHPGFLRLLQQVIDAAHAADRPVTVCGEMASDPEGMLALSFLGVDALSVAVAKLLSARRVLLQRSSRNDPDFRQVLNQVRTGTEVRQYLQSWTLQKAT